MWFLFGEEYMITYYFLKFKVIFRTVSMGLTLLAFHKIYGYQFQRST